MAEEDELAALQKAELDVPTNREPITTNKLPTNNKLPILTLVVLWASVMFWTYAAMRGNSFNLRSGPSFMEHVIQQVKGFLMFYGPYVLASTAIALGRHSLYVKVIGWFMAACTVLFTVFHLSGPRGGGTEGLWLFISMLWAWIVGFLMLMVGIVSYSLHSPSADGAVNANARNNDSA